ncbi:PAAR domain-containing protein [Alkalimarinus alittae]|uniref:PAAR domain-containing protein n=1 Tax=Alkalimarinus alittae TaxID=2961619 RepID=A0ABY6MZ53_9ALTE|nr:PAAR domain-containing protein [Alkalimarinus alittae]UZE95108.1 PAAR domain-containing protein [Alkalimarinus alittae]
MKPIALVGDYHQCPAFFGPVPHSGGPIIKGASTVLINGRPIARMGDQAACNGPLDVIIEGSSTVLVEGVPAARMGDRTAHGGVIVVGDPSVTAGN